VNYSGFVTNPSLVSDPGGQIHDERERERRERLILGICPERNLANEK